MLKIKFYAEVQIVISNILENLGCNLIIFLYDPCSIPFSIRVVPRGRNVVPRQNVLAI